MTTRKTADQKQELKSLSKKDREKKEKQEKRLSNFFNAPVDKSTLESSSISTPNNMPLSKHTGKLKETEPQESPEESTITQAYLKQCLDQQLDQIKLEMQGNFANLKQEIISIGQKAKINEQKIENLEFLIQKQNECIEKQQMKINELEERSTNIEDRGRKNYLRIRNIPESISQGNLANFLAEFFEALKINIDDKRDFLERSHRLNKPRTLPEDLPRDIIIACHSYSFREKILKAARQTEREQGKFKDIKVFPDLSFQTRQARKQFIPATLRLREKDLKYRWGFPTKLIVTKGGTIHTFDSLDKIINWLENLV
ncbi:Hypothetical predicted protein [Pelobates cultripes]|uniref:L1 transposable element RRM domain-containing protein n=1 Tax=Pelobates cultripes TaxID=61616 RepID=A0AAD1SEA6_PELCU|nr:Hypothetical predicted protein [Pelobates cultripes]